MLYKKQILKTLASATVLSAALLAGAQVDAKELTVQHVELASLTDQEKTLVTPGTPTIAEKDLACRYVLVYQPKASTQAATAQLLPSTGSLETDLAVYGMGLTGLSLAGYLVYKNKKTGRHMLLALLIAGGVGSAVTVSADWKLLSPQETITVAVDGQFVVTPQAIDGYEYVGYIADDSCEKPAPTPTPAPTPQPTPNPTPTPTPTPTPSDKDTYEPTATPITVSLGDPLTEDDIKAVVSIPAGSGGVITKIDQIPSTSVAGQASPIQVTVTYPDGTTDVIEVPVTVTNTAPTATATDAAGKVGVATDLTATVTTTDTEDDKSDADTLNKTISYKVTDPAGTVTTLTADEAKAFTPATAGDYTIEVTVTDSQGETATATYTFTSQPLDKDTYEPTAAPVSVALGEPLTEDTIKAAVTIPADSNGTITKVEAIPATTTAGQATPAKVTVTYPDGTTDVIEVPVTVTNTAPTVSATDAAGKVGVATDLTATVTTTDTEDDKSDADTMNKTITYKVTDPAGTVTTLTADEAKAFTPATAGDYTIEVTVTDSQGETATATYILTVAPLDKDLYDPTTTGIVVPVGTVITEDDVKGKVTIPAGSNGVIETVGTIPTTDTAGEKAGVVVTVKYPDGTTDEVTVPVTVTEQTEFAPLARDYFGQSEVIRPNNLLFISGDKDLVSVDNMDNDTYDFLERYYRDQNLFLDQPIHMGKLIADRFQDDPRDEQPDQLKEVKITTLPLYGKLVLVDAAAGTVVDAGNTIQASDLDKLYLVNLDTPEDREYSDDGYDADQRIARDQLGELQATGKLASLGLTTETVDVQYLEDTAVQLDHIGYQYVDTGSVGFNTSATETLTFGYYANLL